MTAPAGLSAALLLGLLGSLHCVAMCGPLALALPVPAAARPGWRGLLPARLAYNLGRAATYAVLGAVVGLLGRGLELAGMQRALSVLAGVAILVHLLGRSAAGGRLLAALRPRALPARPLLAWAARLQGLLAPRLRAGGSPLVFGLLNGLLPCGLVGVALAGAAAAAGPLAGAGFMAAFGLGTLPLMLATALFGGAVTARWGGRLRRWAPLALAALALLFLWRGLAVPFSTHAHAPGVADPAGALGHPPGCPLG